VLLEKTLESDVLQKQAANNTEEQFAASPDLNAVVDNAVIDSMDAQQSLSVQVLNSPEIRAGLIRILLNQLGLYEKLKTRATGV
jgi:type I restriction enzyme R subunit